MRIWDIEPSRLCRKHLLGEHRELHALWTILRESKQGYRHHPETKRWVGKLPALLRRHDALVAEMVRRGYQHRSPLPGEEQVTGETIQDAFIDTFEAQERLLRAKDCACLQEL